MAKNNKTRFFYVLYSDKTWVFDQLERAYYPIYIININKPWLDSILVVECSMHSQSLLYLKNEVINKTTFSVTQSRRKSCVLLITSFFRYTTLCERIEQYTARIDYNQDLFIYIYITPEPITLIETRR